MFSAVTSIPMPPREQFTSSLSRLEKEREPYDDNRAYMQTGDPTRVEFADTTSQPKHKLIFMSGSSGPKEEYVSWALEARSDGGFSTILEVRHIEGESRRVGDYIRVTAISDSPYSSGDDIDYQPGKSKQERGSWGFSNPQNKEGEKQRMREQGHFELGDLPEVIDVEAIGEEFLKQVQRGDFSRPQLIEEKKLI